MDATLPTNAFSAFCNRALVVLADSALKGVLLLAMAWLLAWLFRRRSAAARHLIWLMALSALLLLPALSLWGPQWHVSVLPAASTAIYPHTPSAPETVSEVAAAQSAPQTYEPRISTEIDVEAVSSAAARQTPHEAFPRGARVSRQPVRAAIWILSAWMAGALFVAMRLPIGLVIIARQRRRAAPLNGESWATLAINLGRSLHVTRSVRLLMSEDFSMPMTVGFLHPVIFLPKEARGWTLEKRRMVLLHELAHLRRSDCLTQPIAQVALAFHWFNPMAWLAIRQLTATRELACDDMVLAAGELPSSYATHLLDIARTLHAGHLAAAAAVGMARNSRLEGRLVGILDPARPRRPVTRGMLIIGLSIMAALTLPLAALCLVKAQPAKDGVYAPIVPASSDITGIVEDELGRAVASVNVLAVQRSEDGQRRSARTDAEGHFFFPDLKSGGDWFFSVNDSRYGWEWELERARIVPVNPEDLPLEITLYRSRNLKGIVVGEDKKPVAGARVVLVNELLTGSNEPISGHFNDDFMVVDTDASGHFTMPRLRPGKVCLVLEHPGCADTLLHDIGVDDKEQTLTIQKGLTLHGRVMHDGQPIPNVEVYVGAVAEAHRSMIEWQGKTDARGYFQAPAIPSLSAEERSQVSTASATVRDGGWRSDVYCVYETQDGALPVVTIEAAPVEPGKGENTQNGSVDVRTPGKQSSAASGGVNVNLPGFRGEARVFLSPRMGGTDWIMQNTRNAAASFDEVPPGKYAVSAGGNFSADQPRIPRPIDVIAGQTVNVTLEPGSCSIKGVIRSGGKLVAGGTTISDGYISWYASPTIPGGIFQGGVQVQPDGSYRIDGLPRGSYQLIYEASNAMPQAYIVPVEQEMTPFDISLPTGRIEGTLVGRTPKPLNKYVPVGSIRVWPLGQNLPQHTGCFVEADRAGRFTVDHVSPGRYTIVGYGLATTVKVGGNGSVAKATLRPPERTGEIAGTVTGQIPPILGDFHKVYVTAFPMDEEGYNFHIWINQSALNPRSHGYRIRNLPPGTYGILVSSFGFDVPVTCTWIPDVEVREGLARDLPIEIPEGRAVTVVARDPLSSDPSIPNCTGWRLRMPSGNWLDQAALEGVFALPLGEYTIEADYGDRGVVTQKFTVVRGEGRQKITIGGPK